MKIGIFDSGIGGLITAHSLITNLGQYDYVYLGDTARLPYGSRSKDKVYEFTKSCLEHLFKEEDCNLVIIACNTASADALKVLQTEFVPQNYPDRKVLGILVPTTEEAIEHTKNKKVGVLATNSTVSSGAYLRQFEKQDPGIQVFQQAAPLLVPLIENDGRRWAEPIVRYYVEPLLKEGVDTLVLGCTHYADFKDIFREVVGENIEIISQDDFIVDKLKSYLDNHPEIDSKLTKNGTKKMLLTDVTKQLLATAEKLFEEPAEFVLVDHL
jgi:glutamate racemase